MTKTNKLLSILLSVCMLLSITAGLNLTVYADELETGQCGDDVTYTLDSETGTLTISGTGDMWDYVCDYSPFSYNSSIKSVAIRNGVTSIGDYAFYHCTRLTSITIPDGVTSIGYWAFEYCESLTSITIPDSVTSIGNYAFAECTNLTSITIPNSVTRIGEGAFYDCSNLRNVYYKGTEKEWRNINIKEHNNELLSANIHFEQIHTNGWIKENGKWYYYTNNTAAKGWKKVSGKWYFFNSSGAMVTGWQKVSGKWYYMNKSGAMQTGWQKISGKWYYMNKSGAMQTGWQKISGKWYYMNKSGAMQTGWQKISGKWYYMNKSGAMQTGWQKISGKWYYMYSDGYMAANEWINYKYYVNSSGAWVPSAAKPINIQLGVKKNKVVNWLSSHEDDTYYLGTPYAGRNAKGSSSTIYGWNPTGCIRPNGRYSLKDPGMNCAGFVADVFAYSGAGWKNVEKVGTSTRSYISATAWYDYAMKNNLKYYKFNSVKEALSSGKLSKGDIIYFKPKSTKKDKYGNASETHIGVFWGETSKDNKFWHSSWNIAKGVDGAGTIVNGNQISVMSPLCESYVYVFPLG